VGYLPEARGRPRPPLTKRMRRGHWIALDCVVAAVAGLVVSLSALVSPTPLAVQRVPELLLFAAVIFVPVGFRRLRPVPAYGALIVLAALSYEAISVQAAVAVLVPAAYVLYTVTVTTARRTGVAALGLALALAVVFGLLFREAGRSAGGGAAIPVAFALVLSWMIGYSVRQRRAYSDMIQQQAASSAVAEERLRIARELHDVVAHSMSVIAVQAGYGQYVIDNSPADAREALGAIQATSRDALEEMRRMLGVLRQQDARAGQAAGGGLGAAATREAAMTAGRLGPSDRPPDGPADGPPAPLAPEPGLGDLERLIQRTSGTGVCVTLEVAGEARPLPAGIGLSAYRIIQEALTNVVKHAGSDARCTVRVRYAAGAVGIAVTDDGGHALVPSSGIRFVNPVDSGGTGHGIIGMRERVNLCGGEFSAGPLPDGGFQVTAMLPLPGGRASGGRVA
jgi:signal transduction histidine kinase